jgi:poly(3-hydroxybutyrate) depolymerase
VEYPPGQPGGPSLTVIYIDGHGHAYPGGKESGLPENVLGPNLKKLNATDVIWDFLRKHGG